MGLERQPFGRVPVDRDPQQRLIEDAAPGAGLPVQPNDPARRPASVRTLPPQCSAAR